MRLSSTKLSSNTTPVPRVIHISVYSIGRRGSYSLSILCNSSVNFGSVIGHPVTAGGSMPRKISMNTLTVVVTAQPKRSIRNRVPKESKKTKSPMQTVSQSSLRPALGGVVAAGGARCSPSCGWICGEIFIPPTRYWSSCCRSLTESPRVLGNCSKRKCPAFVSEPSAIEGF